MRSSQPPGPAIEAKQAPWPEERQKSVGKHSKSAGDQFLDLVAQAVVAKSIVTVFRPGLKARIVSPGEAQSS